MSSRNSRIHMLLTALVVLATAVPHPLVAQGFSSCVNFENLTNGDEYNVGDSFSSGGVTITVEGFTWGNGEVTTSGQARVFAGQLAGGSGLDVNTNNVNLDFGFGGPVDGLSLLFGEYGGNLNLEVNGDFKNFGNFDELHMQSVGGVTASVTGGAGNDTGTLTLDGTINSFAIGGQELWIDNVCAGGAVAKAHEVSFFMGGLFTDEDLPLNSGFNTGFRYAYNFYGQFWAELETGIAFTNEVDTEGLLGHAQAQLRWHPLSPTRPVDLFLLIGAGGTTYYTLGASESSPVIILGLGLEFYWLDNVGFRLDAGDVWLIDMFDESTHNWRVLWGPVFWF